MRKKLETIKEEFSSPKLKKDAMKKKIRVNY